MKQSQMKQYEPEELEKLKTAELNILYDFIQVCEKYGLGYFLLWGTAIGAARHGGFIPWDDDIDVGMLREDYTRFQEVVEQEMGEHYFLTTPVTMKGYASMIPKLQRKGTKFVPNISRTMQCELGMHIDIFVYDNLDDDDRNAKKKIRRTRRLAHMVFLCGSPYPVITIREPFGTMARTACFLLHYLFRLMHLSPSKLYQKFEKISMSANGTETKRITTFHSIAAFTNKVEREDIFPLKEIQFEDLHVKIANHYDKQLRQYYGDYMQLPKEEDRVNHGADVIDFGDGSVLKRR